MKTLQKIALGLLFYSANFAPALHPMDDLFGADDAEGAHRVEPSAAAVTEYGKQVSQRMKRLFDDLMVSATNARLKPSKAEDLARLFDADGVEGSLVHFYREEFERNQGLFREDLSQDWPDNSYLDKLFVAFINGLNGFLSWAKSDVLPLLGGDTYRISLTGDDMISQCWAAIVAIEPRALIQKGGAPIGTSRAQFWINKMNDIWALPDMPEFDFGGDAEDAEGTADSTHTGTGTAGAGRGYGHGRRGGIPFIAISGKGVVLNEGQMVVIAQPGSENIYQMQPGSRNIVYVTPDTEVRYAKGDAPMRRRGLPAPVLELADEEVGTAVHRDTSHGVGAARTEGFNSGAVTVAHEGTRSAWRHVPGLVVASASLLAEAWARGGHALTEDVVLAVIAGAVAQVGTYIFTR